MRRSCRLRRGVGRHSGPRLAEVHVPAARGAVPRKELIADPSVDVAHWSHEALDAKLVDQAHPNGACVVDSSKTAWRVAATVSNLQRRYADDFRLVHIVRDPRAVCWSLLKKYRRPEAGSNDVALSIGTTLGWLCANLACELFRRKHPNLYTRVRYEDLASDPVAVTHKVLKSISPSAHWDAGAVGTHDNRHQLYGNRMRRKPLNVREIRVDDNWKKEMPDRLRRIAGSISWPLRARYGYS